MDNSDSSHEHYLIGSLMVLIAAAAFSAKAIIIKLAYAYGTPDADVDAISLMALRMMMALPFFLGVAFWKQRNIVDQKLSMRDWVMISVLGILGYYLASLLDFMGLQYISAGLERLILFLYPTFVVLLSLVFQKRAINRVEVTALLLSYLGIAFVFLENMSGESSQVLKGSLLILASALSFAFFIMGSGVMVKRIGSTKFTAYSMTISCLMTLTHYVITHDFSLPDLPRQVYFLALMLALISTVIPAFLMNAGIKKVGASKAAIISSIGPVSTLVLAYFFLSEEITYVQLFGTALVISGVYLVGRTKVLI